MHEQSHLLVSTASSSCNIHVDPSLLRLGNNLTLPLAQWLDHISLTDTILSNVAKLIQATTVIRIDKRVSTLRGMGNYKWCDP